MRQYRWQRVTTMQFRLSTSLHITWHQNGRERLRKDSLKITQTFASPPLHAKLACKSLTTVWNKRATQTNDWRQWQRGSTVRKRRRAVVHLRRRRKSLNIYYTTNSSGRYTYTVYPRHRVWLTAFVRFMSSALRLPCNYSRTLNAIGNGN